MTPAEILPLTGTEWMKKVNQDEGFRDQLVEMIAKLLWRAYHKHALTAIELLKKEDKDKILKIFGQR